MKECKFKVTIVKHGQEREVSSKLYEEVKALDITKISFQREPDNEYDPNAVVCNYNGKKIGYVVSTPELAIKGSVVAERLSKGLDKGFNVEVVAIGPNKVIDDNNLYFELELKTTVESEKTEAEPKAENTEGEAKERVITLKGATTLCPALAILVKAAAEGQNAYEVGAKVSVLNEPETEEKGLIVKIDNKALGWIPVKDEGYESLKAAVPFEAEFAGLIEKNGLKKATIKVGKIKTFEEIYVEKAEEASRASESDGSLSLSKEEIEERIYWAKGCGCTKELIEKAVACIRVSYEPSSRRRAPKALFRDEQGEYVPFAMDYMVRGLNISLNGPKATGKNTLVDSLAWFFNDEEFEISINAGTTAEDIRGGKTFETDENGNAHIVYEVTQSSECADRGGILCFDEINEGVPEILTVINPMTDKRRRFELPGGGCKEMHPRTRIIATMNNSEEYAGTNEMNNATQGRFMNIQFEYPRSIVTILKEMVKAEGENPEEAVMADRIQTAERLYEKILAEVESENISEAPVNIRGFGAALLCIDYHKALLHGVANMGKTKEERLLLTEMVNDEFPEFLEGAGRTGWN